MEPKTKRRWEFIFRRWVIIMSELEATILADSVANALRYCVENDFLRLFSTPGIHLHDGKMTVDGHPYIEIGGKISEEGGYPLTFDEILHEIVNHINIRLQTCGRASMVFEELRQKSLKVDWSLV